MKFIQKLMTFTTCFVPPQPEVSTFQRNPCFSHAPKHITLHKTNTLPSAYENALIIGFESMNAINVEQEKQSKHLSEILFQYMQASVAVNDSCAYFNDAFESVLSSFDPEDMDEQVDNLMTQIMDEQSIQLVKSLPSVPTSLKST